jgi:hypothetical protein
MGSWRLPSLDWAVLIVILVLMLLPERHSDNFACYRTVDGKIGCKPIN